MSQGSSAYWQEGDFPAQEKPTLSLLWVKCQYVASVTQILESPRISITPSLTFNAHLLRTWPLGGSMGVQRKQSIKSENFSLSPHYSHLIRITQTFLPHIRHVQFSVIDANTGTQGFYAIPPRCTVTASVS